MADDKGIYPFVPQIIKYYLGEDPILGNVETFRASIPAQKQHILANLDKLVVKTVDGSGGYGMLIGPASTQSSARSSPGRSRRTPGATSPADDLAEPAPDVCRRPLEGRHVDLRPFILYGEEIKVLAGGLTRVALPRGSLVVNSSQGGGTKDTWVLRGAPPRPMRRDLDAGEDA